ncbi:hypothetical protein C9183_25305 [Escherichia coli]|nr:hypothetical protein C9183_25305 [Escherichia coli]
MRGNSHAPFLGGGGAAMCRCYPTRLRKSEQQKRHNRKMPHTMTGWKPQRVEEERRNVTG